MEVLYMNVTLRLPDDVAEELNDLSQMFGVSKNRMMIMCIRSQFHAVKSDPEITKLQRQVTEMQSLLDKFRSE